MASFNVVGHFIELSINLLVYNGHIHSWMHVSDIDFTHVISDIPYELSGVFGLFNITHLVRWASLGWSITSLFLDSLFVSCSSWCLPSYISDVPDGSLAIYSSDPQQLEGLVEWQVGKTSATKISGVTIGLPSRNWPLSPQALLPSSFPRGHSLPPGLPAWKFDVRTLSGLRVALLWCPQVDLKLSVLCCSQKPL